MNHTPDVPDTPSDLTAFSEAERERYARHFSLEEIGVSGQRALKDASVLIVGAGGLGCPAALYLAAAGVGRVGLADPDRVDASNLQRQVLYGVDDVGAYKVDLAAARMEAIQPEIQVDRHRVRVTSENALELLEPYDIVIDGTDNFPTRYLVNDACILLGKPNVYGSILRWEGQLSLFGVEAGPCYRCLFREPPPAGLVPNCAEAGVIGALPGMIGSAQALEAIKWVTGVGEGLVGRLLLFDARSMHWREIELRRDPECPVCGDRPTQTTLIDYEDFCGVGAGPSDDVDEEITAAALRGRIDAGTVTALVDVREIWEWEAGNLSSHGAIHIPLGELAERLGELPGGGELVVYCKMGGRSARAAEMLRASGLERVLSLEGGYDGWIEGGFGE